MKTLIAILALATSIQSAEVMLHWEPSPTPEVNAYRLHAWRSGDPGIVVTNKPLFSLFLPNITNATARGLTFDNWTFTVTALVTNQYGFIESSNSNPVVKRVMPLPPVLKND